jgi:hypothetical protein
MIVLPNIAEGKIAMSFTRQVYLEVDGEKDLSLLLAYRNGESDPDTFEIEVFQGKEAVGKGRWSVDAEHFALLFHSVAETRPGISKSLGIAVGKGLIDGLWDADGDRQKLRKGVKDSAVAVLLDAAGRVADCL